MQSRRTNKRSAARGRIRKTERRRSPEPVAHYSEAPPADALQRLRTATLQLQDEVAEVMHSNGPFPPLITPFAAIKLWAKAWDVWAAALGEQTS